MLEIYNKMLYQNNNKLDIDNIQKEVKNER